MKEAQFIPGFDWLRIIGSILVVVTHYAVFNQVYVDHPLVYRMLSFMIPAFFIMSGYLGSVGFSRKRVFKQVIKYGAIYLAISFLLVLYGRIMVCVVDGGQFKVHRLVINFLKCFVYHNPLSMHLWFIPALLYPMILNAFLDGKARRIVIAIGAAVVILNESAGLDTITGFFTRVTADFPLVTKMFTASELTSLWRRLWTGLLFTTIGFDIGTWRIKPVFILLAAVPFAALDLWVHYTGITAILLSIAFFYWLKGLPGRFLYPYHFEISVFAGLMYFLHMIEKLLLDYSVPGNTLVKILYTIGINLVITLVISCLYRRKKAAPGQQLHYGL
jgi:hypothetical protein